MFTPLICVKSPTTTSLFAWIGTNEPSAAPVVVSSNTWLIVVPLCDTKSPPISGRFAESSVSARTVADGPVPTPLNVASTKPLVRRRATRTLFAVLLTDVNAPPSTSVPPEVRAIAFTAASGPLPKFAAKGVSNAAVVASSWATRTLLLPSKKVKLPPSTIFVPVVSITSALTEPSGPLPVAEAKAASTVPAKFNFTMRVVPATLLALVKSPPTNRVGPLKRMARTVLLNPGLELVIAVVKGALSV